MTERRPSFADILSPEQIRQYMTEAGYAQPPAPAYPVPPPMDVPAVPPADLVEYRGTIEFQAHWELPAVANRSRDDLIGDIMSTLGGQEAAWLPRLRYRVADLRRIDPNARPAPPADPRPRWQHPTNGTLWRVNPNGSLDPESQTPPIATPHAWMAAERSAAERDALMAEMASAQMDRVKELTHEGRLDGLERLATDLAAQIEALGAQRPGRRAARRQRRLRGGDLRADGDDSAALPDADVRDGLPGPGGGGSAPGPADADPGSGGGGDRVCPSAPGGIEASEATPDPDQGRSDRSKRKPDRGFVAIADLEESTNATSLPESEQ